MPLPPEPLIFSIQVALRRALKMVSGLRRQISERDERLVAIKLITEINLAHDIVRKSVAVGHTTSPENGSETESEEPGQ